MSQGTIVHQEEALTIYWDPQARYHIARWQGFLHGEPFHAALQACVSAAGARRSTKWVADVRKYSVTTPEDQQWIIEHFFPRMVEAGVEYFAIVSPERVVAAMSAKSVIHAFKGGQLEFGYHESEKDAVAWLQTKPNIAGTTRP